MGPAYRSPVLRIQLASTLRLLLILLLATPSLAAAQDDDRKISPFSSLRWVDDFPQVRIDDEWYQPVSIAGTPVQELLDFCGQRWPGKARKRFAEDLAEAMSMMGKRLPDAVDLELIRLSDQAEVVLKGVAATEQNRRALRDQGSGELPRPKRAPTPPTLTQAQAKQDLSALAARLRDQFAYLELGNVAWESKLREIELGIDGPISTSVFATQIQGLIASFQDGHARARSEAMPRPATYPQWTLAESQGRVVALTSDRAGLLDAAHPYAIEIDGIAVGTWLKRAAQRIPQGSPQYVRAYSISGLRELELLRQPGDKFDASFTRVLLSNARGDSEVEVDVPMRADRPRRSVWPESRSKILDGNIGYLRIPAMDDRLVPQLVEVMQDLRETEGLIVDVRGNGGGSRSILIALAGYLADPESGYWVGNAAKYRLSASFDDDHLEARYMWRADDRKWNADQRKAIQKFARGFKPEWSPRLEFSEWHYLVLGPNPEVDHYDKPVIVLCDALCFSATDIFLAALSGRPNITLMGQASGGGSARSQRFTLPNSQIEVQCASMVSYQPNGMLYDTRGVAPDVVVHSEPLDHVRDGTDSVLQTALEKLRD